MNDTIRKAASLFAGPVLREPAFFCLTVFLLSFSHVLYAVEGTGLQLSPGQWRIVLSGLSVSVFLAWGMAAALPLLPRRVSKATAYAAASLLLLADLFLFFNFQTLLSPWILLLLKETTGSEASEFLQRYLPAAASMRCYGCLAAFLLTTFLLERKRFRLPLAHDSLWLSGIVSMALLPVLTLGAYLFLLACRLPLLGSQYDFEMWHERRGFYAIQSTPTNLLYSALYLRVSGQDNARAIRTCQDAASQPASCLEQDTLNVVLVIGESFSKRHTPLYGYALDTTPRLCAMRDSGSLFVFRDVVAPYNMTTFSVKNILSTNSLSDGEPWYACPSFPVIFKKAGFHVSVWDNQRPAERDVSVYDYALGSYMYAPQMLPIAYHECNSATYDYDMDLVQACRRRLGRQAQGRSHPRLCLYIFHLMGQHSDAACRFPHTQDLLVFKAEDIGRDDLDAAARQAIADYDNATRYNDLVVSSIADMFRDTPSVMLYLSDHGEEVYDYRPFIGRSHERRKTREALECQYGIPFVVWCSDRYRAMHPRQMEAIRQAQDKPATADDVAHTLFSLASIQSPYYQAGKDLLSPDYAAGRRILQGYIDYDNR